MNDKMVLNILNGQAMHDYFIQNKLDKNGVYVPFNEAMCVGEVTADIFSKEFNKFRCGSHDLSMDKYSKVTLKPLEILIKNQFSTIVLWFDDDMFCQINLLTIIAYLDQIGYSEKITFNLVNQEFKLINSFNLEVKGYHEIYKQVMIDRCITQNIDLYTLKNGINLYLEFLKEENEITRYIKNHNDLEINILLTELLKEFSHYGLGDIQYIQLIEKIV